MSGIFHISYICSDKVDASDRFRGINDDAVVNLMNSMAEEGQLNPIWVRPWDYERSTHKLVIGLHRLEAARRLGWASIEARITDKDEVECRLMEIAENLHRSELTATERSEQLAEWIRLTEERRHQGVLAQVAPKLGRPESGVKAAARELGIERTEAQRAVKIAAITPEAKEAAKAAGLDDNQSALLKVASYADADQVEAVAAIVREKAEKPKSQPKDTIISLSADEYKVLVDKAEATKAAVASVADKYISRTGVPGVPYYGEGRKVVVETLLSTWSAATRAERAAFMSKVGLVLAERDDLKTVSTVCFLNASA
jgi:ParB/RepB/Spo0J family partition protein